MRQTAEKLEYIADESERDTVKIAINYLLMQPTERYNLLNRTIVPQVQKGKGIKLNPLEEEFVKTEVCTALYRVLQNAYSMKDSDAREEAVRKAQLELNRLNAVTKREALAFILEDAHTEGNSRYL